MRSSPRVSRRCLAALLFLVAAEAGAQQPELPTVVANTNTERAGSLRDGTLELALVVATARWHPEALDGPSVVVEAFAVEGEPPSVPGPLLRVRLGTTIAVQVRNDLPDTLLVFGLSSTAGVADTMRIAPGATGRARVTPAHAGTFAYGGVTIVDGTRRLLGVGNQLLGAFVVDDDISANNPDRIFVLSIWPPEPGRFVMAINGRSWPHTERLETTVGDSMHWRVVNGTRGRHPMHLHGFYFRIDARGSWTSDSVFASDRPMVVTESVPYRGTFAMTWVAERPGNWLFHCHDLLHTTWRRRFNLSGQRPPRTLPMEHGAPHAEIDMSGLVLGIVAHARDAVAAPRMLDPQRRIRLLVEEHAGHFGAEPAYTYTVDEGAHATAGVPRIPAAPLVLTRGERTEITVVNRMTLGTSVHWHGIELDSYFDGVAGWSGEGNALAPMIEPGDSFVVRITPPRAGTFIVHAHADDVRQVALGLHGPLIVVPADEPFDSTRDHIFVVSQLGRGQNAATMLNGSAAPAPVSLARDVVHRLRFINIGVEYDAVFTLHADGGPASWRGRAKDGADLSEGMRTLVPATVTVAPGETYDFEITLPAGDYQLRMESSDTVEQSLHVQRGTSKHRGRLGFTRTREDIDQPGDYRTDAEIWLMNEDGSGARRLTRNTSDDYGVAWSPEGTSSNGHAAWTPGAPDRARGTQTAPSGP
jgi:manganese oxidase